MCFGLFWESKFGGLQKNIRTYKNNGHNIVKVGRSADPNENNMTLKNAETVNKIIILPGSCVKSMGKS